MPKKPENSHSSTTDAGNSALDSEKTERSDAHSDRPAEIGGQKGPEPTRYGDWEKNGRCTDF